MRFIEYMDVGGATHWSMDRVVTRDQMIASLEQRYGLITPSSKRRRRPPIATACRTGRRSASSRPRRGRSAKTAIGVALRRMACGTCVSMRRAARISERHCVVDHRRRSWLK